MARITPSPVYVFEQLGFDYVFEDLCSLLWKGNYSYIRILGDEIMQAINERVAWTHEGHEH